MLKLNNFTTEKLFEQLKNTCSKEFFYWTQRRSLIIPPQANNDVDFVRSNERDEMIAYILEICDRADMSLSIETFSLTVSLVDRFLSNYKVRSKYLECLAIACLYIACKVKEEDENISITSEFLLDCDCKCSVSELLRMEQMILTKFEWSVNDTTAVDFLYIYYALLVNQYNSYEPESGRDGVAAAAEAEAEAAETNIWILRGSSIPKPVMNVYRNMLPPPSDLDFLHELEYKMKQILCVNKLTTNYKPHQLAFSLLSIQLDKSLETIPSAPKRELLEVMLKQIRNTCKLSYETVDKCKSLIRGHLLSIENTKSLFDRYFMESSVTYRLLRDYKPSSLFIPQLSAAVARQLSAIQEEDEEDIYEEERAAVAVGIGSSSNFYGLSKHGADAEAMVAEEQTANNFYESAMDQESKFMSYADILMGRRDSKRKLSENSSGSDGDVGELEYESRIE